MKKFFKYLFIIFLGIIVLVSLILAIVWFISKEDREIARNFTLLSSKGLYEEASDLMHDSLKKEFSIESFENAFTNSKPYIETSFPSISISNSVTTLEGTANTKDNCSSKLYFEILDSKIISFNINPLCSN